MLVDISNVDAIYIVCGRTDMRKSIDVLCTTSLHLHIKVLAPLVFSALFRLLRTLFLIKYQKYFFI